MCYELYIGMKERDTCAKMDGVYLSTRAPPPCALRRKPQGLFVVIQYCAVFVLVSRIPEFVFFSRIPEILEFSPVKCGVSRDFFPEGFQKFQNFGNSSPNHIPTFGIFSEQRNTGIAASGHEFLWIEATQSRRGAGARHSGRRSNAWTWRGR